MEHTILILILPFLSFLILGLAGMRMKNGLAGTIGTVSLAGVPLLSYLTAFTYFAGGRTAEGVYPTLTPYNFEWLPFTTNLHIDMGIMLDPISVMMLVVISTVSLMVHIYLFGYMKGEKMCIRDRHNMYRITCRSRLLKMTSTDVTRCV